MYLSSVNNFSNYSKAFYKSGSPSDGSLGLILSIGTFCTASGALSPSILYSVSAGL